MSHINIPFSKFTDSNILITGSTGFVGYRLTELLSNNTNSNIFCLVRSFGNATKLSRLPVKIIKGNILNPDDLKSVFKEIDYVFHCAYGNSGDENNQISTNVNGTDLVCKYALKNNIKRLVFLSTISVYEYSNDEWITEKSKKTSSKESYSSSKLAAEKIINNYINLDNLPAVILQPTAIYGPWAPSYVMKTFKKLKNSTIPLIEDGRGICNAVYIDDLIFAMLLSATNDKAIGETYIVNGDDYITWKKYYSFFDEILGRSTFKIISNKELKNHLYPKKPSFFLTVLKSMKPNISFLKSELKNHAFINYLYSKVSLKNKIRFTNIFLNKNKIINKKNQYPLMIINNDYVLFHKQISKASIVKIKRDLNYSPIYSFEDGFNEIKKWYLWFYNK